MLTHRKDLACICLLIAGLFIGNRSLVAQDTTAFQLKPLQIGFDYQLQVNHLDISPQLWLLRYKSIQASAELHALYYFNNSDRKGKLAYGYGTTWRYITSSGVFGQASFQQLSVPVRDGLDMTFKRGWKSDIFLGVGYLQNITNKCQGQIAVLYNVNYKSYSAYESRILVKAGAVWKVGR